MLLGVGLRSYQLDYNFDGDEIFSVQAARGSLNHLFHVTLEDVSHPPLYYLVLHVWLKCFKPSEVSVRIPSIAFSVLFLVSLQWVVAKLHSRSSALLAVVLCSVSPFFVFYGEQARPYSLAAFLAMLSMAVMLQGMESASRRWELAYGIIAAALVYTQFLGFLVLLPQFVLLVISRIPSHRRLLVAGSVGVLSILAWLSILATHLGDQPAARILWIGRPEPLDLVRFFLGLCGYLNLDGSTRVLVVLYVAAVAGLFFQRHDLCFRLLPLLGALAVFGPVSLWVVSRFGPVSIWAPRQLVGSAAFFFVLLSIGLSAYKRGMGFVVAAALVAWCLVTVPNEFPSHSRPPWRSIASMIDSEPSDTAIVASEAFIGVPLEYYARRPVHLGATGGGSTENAHRFLLLCRPSHCQIYDELARQHRLVKETTIDWVRYAAKPTSILKTYLFEH
jgi:4-amino-4-deoxy-L-arabinose transferase-like glycosyltransferase